MQKIKWMMQYFLRDGEDYDYEAIEAKCFFSIDYQKLIGDEILLEVWSQLKDDLYTSAADTLATFSLAMHQVKFAYYIFPFVKYSYILFFPYSRLSQKIYNYSNLILKAVTLLCACEGLNLNRSLIYAHGFSTLIL